MVLNNENLVENLIKDGYLKTALIINAFKAVDRKDFVRDEDKEHAYVNYPLAIGFGQTISQPLTVAFMLELLSPKLGEKILDIGAGSGWQTALLAQIVGEQGKVIAIERIPELKIFAEKNIGKYGFIEKGIVKIIEGDGSKSYELDAPFDKIIAAATSKEIPDAWKKQLKIGGFIVAPVNQSIYVLGKTGPEEFSKKQYFGFSFVPLVTD
ncbi:MAG: protein-L-isoaspartate O-methyltransferase [Patescibacteria group bacterium]|nr:protein-L-isoaspartate O-methyltransferase [Patescibacteria group bacterium]